MTGATQFKDRMTGYLLGRNALASVPMTESPAQAERLQIYRNNYVKACSDAVLAAYPGVLAFVGEAFLRAVARDYVAEHPPLKNTLSLYGDQFPEFMKEHQAVRAHPYVSAVAALDRAWLEVHLEKDAVAASGADLSTWMQNGGDVECAQMALIPAARLVEVPWTVVRPWMDCREGRSPEGKVDIATANDYALIWRYDDVVRYRQLGVGEWAFLKAVDDNAQLGAAASQALCKQNDFDIGSVLAGCLGAGLFQGPVGAGSGER
jgi:hypothetical protein